MQLITQVSPIFRLARRLRRWFVLFPLRIGVLAIFYILRPAVSVKLMMLGERRIGQWVQTTDFFLRRRRSLGKAAEPSKIWIGVTGDPSNEQLLKMFRRHMPIYRNRRVRNFFFHGTLRKTPLIREFPLPITPQDYELCNEAPVLSFTDEEES